METNQTTELTAQLLDVCLGMADLIDRCGVKVNADFDQALRDAIAKAEVTSTDSAIEAMQSSEIPIVPGLLRRHELEQGKTYMPCDAKGEEVQGVYESVTCAAYIDGITLDKEDSQRPGGIDFEYAGDSKVFWDGQEPEYNAKGEYQFITQEGDELSESQLYYREVQA